MNGQLTKRPIDDQFIQERRKEGSSVAPFTIAVVAANDILVFGVSEGNVPQPAACQRFMQLRWYE